MIIILTSLIIFALLMQLMMANKELQEQRMRGYFIQATKEILKSEGIAGISVRNIADKAGYSYATLYNYFKDVNELIFLCVNDFQHECDQFTQDQTKDIPEGPIRIKALSLAYMRFFAEYPGIFDLFYIAKVGDFGNKQSTIDIIGNSLDSICEPAWDASIKQNLFSENEAQVLRMNLRSVVIGLLLLYMNRRIPDSYNEFIGQSTTLIDNMLGLVKL